VGELCWLYIVYNVYTYSIYTTCIHVIYHTPSYKLQARAYDRFLRQIVRIYIYVHPRPRTPHIWATLVRYIIITHIHVRTQNLDPNCYSTTTRVCSWTSHDYTYMYIYIYMRYAKYHMTYIIINSIADRSAGLVGQTRHDGRPKDCKL